MRKMENDKIKKALKYALMLLMDQAEKGLYPEAALQENGGQGFKPITDALESLENISPLPPLKSK
jgi:hypothetical protein